MKQYLKTYWPFLRFLLLFFCSYGLFSFLYHLYLSQYETLDYPIDPFTLMVSNQVDYIGSHIDPNIETQLFPQEAWTRLIYNGKGVARIVEGCNAISVMILFLAFVIAFSRNIWSTLIFSTVGIILIHSLNIFRIIFLSILMYKYPEYNHLSHGVLFPLIIYGFVFLLWILWVKRFSGFITVSKEQ